jgi:hypothetical protein
MRDSQNDIRRFATERPAHIIQAVYDSLGFEIAAGVN